MACDELNEDAVAKCRSLIDAHQYVLDSDWLDAQPLAEQQNDFLERHGWDDYRAWHLGLTVGANDETRRDMRSCSATSVACTALGLIACVYRGSEWRHKAVELAAHDLLQHVDAVAG